MKEVIALHGQPRSGLGKKSSKALRNDGRIPCVLYGENTLVHFSVAPLDVRGIIYTPDFKIIDLHLEGKTYRAILKDYQLDPLTDQVRHIDLMKLTDGHAIKVEVPIRFRGSSPGVKIGGKLQQNLRRAKIKTMPENLVDELMIDISKLELGQSIRVRDLDVPAGIEVMNNPSIPVATVEIPRALRSAAAAAEKDDKKKK
ncbi:MAG: 50S ribosomal protein L25 [Lewinellaceae bacterium]|nr:50S ribosomal protein L25 [Lewinellaceae bacterium]